MRLKQIKLAGFKSFVDATTVTLPGNRCAVVGPNGCGKSNIIDAVRWVMGESSAKQLRGENLTDVIFNGANTRKPVAAASIELLFDNSDGRIGGEYSAYADIAIRRQVTRDGQSQYYLNGNKCRRRDIQDIFLGTGFGPRSYSIIEQGMISQLVEAKPEELRVYLEEAAGISKYKERRRETNNRIKHTKENLERINDIREELARQLDRLQRQAQAAARYRELRAEETILTAQLLALKHSNLSADLGTRQAQISEREIELEKNIATLRELEKNIEQSRKTHADTTDEFNQVQGQYYQLGSDIARIEETIQFNQQRVKQLELDLQTVEQRSVETQQQLSMDEAAIVQLKADINEIIPKVENLAGLDAQKQADLEAVEELVSEWQERWDTFNKSAAEIERMADVEASRIEHQEQIILRLTRRQEALSHQSEQAQTAQGESVEVDQLAQEIVELEHQSRVLDHQIDESLRELGAAKEDVLVRERTLDEARNEVQSLRHDLATLQAKQEAALGQHVQEAEDWIAAHNLTASARLGEFLAVVPGWEVAVEAVLGRFISALKVDQIDSLAGALATLPDGDLALIEQADAAGGDHLGHSHVDLPTLQSLIRSDGVQLGSLLHGVYAADSADTALARRNKLAPGESIITREGFWMGPDWVRVVHNRDEQTGVIERAQEIETLSLRVEEAERTLGDLLRHLQEGRARIDRLEAQRTQYQQQATDLNKNLGQRRTHHGVTQVKIEEADARRAQIIAETEDIGRQLSEEQERLRETRVRLADALQSREGLAEQRDLLTGERDEVNQRVNSARNDARSSREEYHQLNVQKESLQSRLVASNTARERLLNLKAELSEQKDNLSGGIEQSQTPLPRLQQELETKLAARVSVEEQLGNIRTQLQTAETQTRTLEGQRVDQEQRVELVREALQEARVERQGLAVQEANILEQFASTNQDLEQIKSQMPEEATEQGWVESLEKMERRINRLGAINLAAIEEYEQESERKVYLDAQAEDLEQALETLLDAIRKIDRETRTRFKETFEAVNTRLGELFPKVFGGGHAYLELTGEDLLDTGVSLMARPPGKRNASVHLLSGGEKAMTAVALIFAIFHLNPSPVCLLDEVDAPLDDANVTRFAKLIEEMSADVQFLVITHNKITMEMADYLMGVTMQEPGVSRLVSVDVDEAAAMAVM